MSGERAASGAMFGVERLKQLIEESSTLSARELFLKIGSSIEAFIGKAPPFDDLTLIVIRVR